MLPDAFCLIPPVLEGSMRQRRLIFRQINGASSVGAAVIQLRIACSESVSLL